jgi:hypothetical protein
VRYRFVTGNADGAAQGIRAFGNYHAHEWLSYQKRLNIEASLSAGARTEKFLLCGFWF